LASDERERDPNSAYYTPLTVESENKNQTQQTKSKSGHDKRLCGHELVTLAWYAGPNKFWVTEMKNW
jgi:hypothetical protein